MQYPAMHRIRQTFQADSIQDIEGAVRQQMSTRTFSISAGARIAVAVGSRGIHDIQPIVKTVVACLKDMDLDLRMIFEVKMQHRIIDYKHFLSIIDAA